MFFFLLVTETNMERMMAQDSEDRMSCWEAA